MAELAPESRRRLIAGSTLGAGVLLALVLLGLVNYLGWKYYRRFDWTASDLYTLSEKSVNVARSLDEEVEVTVFTSPGAPLADGVTEILDRYQAVSPRLTVRVVDPIKNLAEAERLLTRYDTRYQEGTVKVVFSRAGERRIFEESDLADYDYSAMQMGGAPEVSAFKGEEVFTAALIELAAGERPEVLFTTGHGERGLDDFSAAGLQAAQELLGRDNVDIEGWASLTAGGVPEGTDLVIVAGPTSSFAPPELAAFDRYLDAGGRMLVMVDPTLADDGQGLVELGLEDWLAGYGVEIGDDLAIDPDRAVPFYGAETLFVADYGFHPVVEALSQAEVPVIFAGARSVSPGEAPPGLTVGSLLETSQTGWGETELAALPQVEQGPGDRPGPVSLGVAVERPAERAASVEEGGDEAVAGTEAAGTSPGGRPAMRLVVLGDTDFASDGQIANAGNGALLDNAFNWLIERETFLGIPPKKPEQARLNLESDQLLRIYLLAAALPLAAIVAGVAVYFRRRR